MKRWAPVREEGLMRATGSARKVLGGGEGVSTERISVLQCPHGGCLEALLGPVPSSWQNVGLHRARSTLEHSD